MRVACPSCGAILNVPEAALGKKGLCPTCGVHMRLPEAPPPPPPPPKPKSKPTLVAKLVDVPPPPRSQDVALPVERPWPEAPPRRQTEEEDDRPRRRSRRGEFTCPYCNTTYPPVMKKKVSTAGWVIFCVLLLGCFPLCLVGLLITEPYRVCSECGAHLP